MSTAGHPVSLAKRFLFSLVGLALVVVLIETAVHWIWRPAIPETLGETPGYAPGDVPPLPDVRPGREKAGLGFRDPTMALHPYLGYVFLPKEEREEPGHPAIAISEDGFLDNAPAVRERSDGRLIVGVMGGSVSGQLGTWHSELFTGALREQPAFADLELDFVWLGMPGYHQPQQLFQLGWLLAQGGELDLLVNLDGFNEIAVPGALNAPQGAHPLFPMNWSMVALDVPDPEVRRHVGAIAYLKDERRARAAKFRASLWSRSPTATLLWKLGDDSIARRITDLGWSLQELPTEEIPWFVRGPGRAHAETDALIPRLVDVWKRSSLQMQALCAAEGIRYLHCLQPNQYDPSSKRLSGAEKREAYDANGPYLPVIEQGYPLLRAAGEELRAAGVAFVDLSHVFEDVGETLYVDSCCHFNAEGNRIVATAIAEAAQALF